MRDEKPLRFERPALQPGEQLLVHDPLMQRVLIDDHEPIVALRDEVTVVKLDRRLRLRTATGDFDIGARTLNRIGRRFPLLTWAIHERRGRMLSERKSVGRWRQRRDRTPRRLPEKLRQLLPHVLPGGHHPRSSAQRWASARCPAESPAP